jgi:hypothetical protein
MHPEGLATGHLDKGFLSWVSSVFEQMLLTWFLSSKLLLQASHEAPHVNSLKLPAYCELSF